MTVEIGSHPSFIANATPSRAYIKGKGEMAVYDVSMPHDIMQHDGQGCPSELTYMVVHERQRVGPEDDDNGHHLRVKASRIAEVRSRV